jgi:PPIC-type PPIASE domain
LKIIYAALVCLFLTGVVFGQANSQPVVTSPNAVQDLTPSSDNSSISPDAPVITVQGVCDKAPGTDDCKTVVTRAEWERLVNALQPNMPKPAQKQLASRYVQAIILAGRAHQMGLDKGPEFDEQLYLARLQLLARMAGEHIQKDSAKVSDAEVESYYHQHSGDFKTISYDKIFVPKQKQGATPATATGTDAEKKRQAAEAEMKAEAEKLHSRAAAGEDFTKLQQEAYNFAGMKLTASSTRVEKVKKNALLANDASIFDLKKGEISPVITDPQGFMIYKVEDTQEQPLADIKEEVSRAAQQEKLKSASEEIQKSATQNTKYDDAYFAVPAPPTLKKPGEPGSTPAPETVPPAPGQK